MKEIVSKRQCICMIILIMLSESFVIGPVKGAKSDIWISILLAIAIACLISIIYASIMKKYPDKNLYEILIEVFGRFIGNVISILYVLYCFYIGALVLSVFILFTSVVGLLNTPVSVIAFCVTVLVIAGLKRGLEVLGRWSEFFTKIIYPIILITVPLMLSMVEAFNLTPVLANGIRPVIEGAFEMVTFPFAEIFTFMLIISVNNIRECKNYYKIYLTGILLGGLILFGIHVSAYLCLGEFAYTGSYFPIYSAVSRINIRDILQRIESIIAVIFILAGFVKISIYLLAGCKGVASILKLKDYRLIVTPLSFIVLILSLTTVTSIIELETHIYYYNFLAILMQIIFPVLILIAVEIKSKLANKGK